MSEERQIKNTIIKKPWIQPLLEYFKTIKKYNDIIETVREKLCLNEKFNPNELFNYLDFQKNEFLTSKNIINFLNETKTKYSEQYVRVLIHNYDKDGDFTLNIKEFLNMVLPTKKRYIKEKIIKNEKNKNNEKISLEIKNIFNELIKEELNLAESSFYAIKNIYGSKKFTTYEAFIDIVKNESYITRKNLNIFLRENEYELNDDDIYLIMFRIDNDNDNRISYIEFQDIFYPLKKLEKYNENVSNDNDIKNSLINKNNLYEEKGLDNNYELYSKYCKYDYNKYNDYILKNNYLKNNYYIKDNYNYENIKEKIFNVGEYQIFINKINDNLIYTYNGTDNIYSNENKNEFNDDGTLQKNNEVINNNKENDKEDNNKNEEDNNKGEEKKQENNKDEENINSEKFEENKEDFINKHQIKENIEKSKEDNNINDNNDNINIENGKEKNNIENNKNDFEKDKNEDNKDINVNNNEEINDHNIENNIIDDMNDNKNLEENQENIENEKKDLEKNNEEKIETLTEELVIKDSEEKNSQGFTNSRIEKKEENIKDKNLDYKNLQSQICFNFSILGNKNEIKELKLKSNPLIKSFIPIKDNKYNYISATERILNKSRKIYPIQENKMKNEFNFNTPSVNYKYKYLTERENNINQLDNNIEFNNKINNEDINNDNNIGKTIEDRNINQYININSYITPKINRNQQSIFNLRNSQTNNRTPNIENINKTNNSSRTEIKPRINKLIIKNDALFELLNDYIIQDTTTENILENLSICPDFNLINLFQNFLQSDFLNRRIITEEDIYKTLTNMGLYVNKNDIKYIFSKFNKKINKDKETGFSYSEFCYMMTPKKYGMAKNLNNKENQKYFMGFSFKTKRIICSLFKQFIDSEKSNENYRCELIGNGNNIYKIYYSIDNLFNSLKKKSNNGIDKNDINDFMKMSGKNLCKFELELLMDRFDKNKDNIIDFEEFFNEIIPKLKY